MTEFILGMREKYLKDEAKMVLVTHDWGAIIGARLAAEASQLADRWVIASLLIVRLLVLFRTSGLLTTRQPEHAYSNTVAKAASAKQMLHTYIRQPTRVSLLKNAYNTIKPVLSQFRRSFYICQYPCGLLHETLPLR